MSQAWFAWPPPPGPGPPHKLHESYESSAGMFSDGHLSDGPMLTRRDMCRLQSHGPAMGLCQPRDFSLRELRIGAPQDGHAPVTSVRRPPGPPDLLPSLRSDPHPTLIFSVYSLTAENQSRSIHGPGTRSHPSKRSATRRPISYGTRTKRSTLPRHRSAQKNETARSKSTYGGSTSKARSGRIGGARHRERHRQV